MRRKFHQWESFGVQFEDVTYTDGKIYRAIKCMECVKCGLRKGRVEYKSFGTTAYYENGIIHSLAILPFECISYDRLNTPYQREKKLKKGKTSKQEKTDGFLSKDDFYV